MGERATACRQSTEHTDPCVCVFLSMLSLFSKLQEEGLREIINLTLEKFVLCKIPPFPIDIQTASFPARGRG